MTDMPGVEVKCERWIERRDNPGRPSKDMSKGVQKHILRQVGKRARPIQVKGKRIRENMAHNLDTAVLHHCSKRHLSTDIEPKLSSSRKPKHFPFSHRLFSGILLAPPYILSNHATKQEHFCL